MTSPGGDSTDGSDLHGLGAVPLADGDPRQIGPFTLMGRLGSGGMGRVFLGVADGRFAAVKQVHPHLTEDKEFVQRFGHELDNLARLPAGVSADLLDSDREAQPPWLAAAYVPGITLDEALELNGGPLSVPDVWLLLREAAAGLAAVHEIGVMHRDLKPSNVMLRQDGVTLIDFGVARALEQSRLTQSGMVIGTPAYMSPEQASSDRGVTEATDVFALGCLLGYAATGRPPYGDGGGVQMLYRIVHEEPDLEPLLAVDGELAAVVAQCLARAPQDRPTSAELVEWATRHVGLAVTPWPSRVRERLALRAEAVQRVPDMATTVMAHEPDGPAAPAAPATAAEQVAAGGVEPERPKRRRFRTFVIPLLIVASAGAVALLPYMVNQPGGGTPSASGNGTTSPVATVGTPSGPTSASAAVSTSASASPSTPKASASASPHANGGGSGGASGGSTRGSSGATGTGGAGASGGSGGSGGSAGTSAGSTSGSTGTRGGSGGGVTPSGTRRLRSALDGTCLAQSPSHSTSAYLAACGSGSPFEWTYTSVSGGTFELLNPDTGNCLAGSGNNFTYMVSCGSTDADVWKFGPSTSSGAPLENPSAGQCLQNDAAVGGYAVLTACGSSADEAWSND